jgi:hypothetical protein
VKTKRTTKHRGEILQQVVEASGMSVSKVTERAGYSRSSYYYHILDPELPFEIMQKYGKAMKYDFKADFPEMSESILDDDEKKYIKPTSLEQAVRQLEILREKYLALLEKYQQLIEEKIKK